MTNDIEIWKEIPGFCNYQASSLGRIRNTYGKILMQQINGPRPNNKYMVITLLKSPDGSGWKERKKTIKVHRLVLMAFHGFPDKGKIGCHRNHIKTDNKISNLYWGTYKDNAQDAIRAGTFNFPHPGIGDKHHSCKYPDALIKKIKEEYTGKRGEQTALEKKYGVPQKHISAIVNGKMRVAA